MKILITGSNGMLANAVIDKFKDENELILTDVQDLDITNYEDVLNFVNENKPDCIINCAAYTAVDKAEEQEELANKINADGPKNLAKVAKENNSILVHISTDYVFGGDKDTNESYLEDEPKKPVTAYGRTKLNGENEVTSNCDKYYIFRTAWLYGEGNNFVRTMIKLGKEREEVGVVADQHGSPTYAVDLASIIYQALNKKIPYGIYHATNQGFTTWYDFTKEIYELSNINCNVKPLTSDEFPRPAKRPANSKLSKEKLISCGVEVPDYKEALERYLKKELNKNEE